MAHEELEQKDVKSHSERRPNQRPNLKSYHDQGNGLQCEHRVK